ncbi:Sir2 family NAD-dependent protein deacetylase [Lysinibacter sp. HNR]|uniref:Sir2 family NAD-dependent protein deacetylase n=1 Tax=Lysinibacter sp. HNR TaxID=3031408 RepID=UPI0024357098|nr:Sir2 family NAD-dependent protein deacetylase [Lysinibacter sp. HNR]WGD36206.1 Sir2 family NAD-dependent protein deacetylase [Lysinibacter sp. HNR]
MIKSAYTSILTTLSEGPWAVLTGAGISTDSGIPDYRGEGAPPRNPMSVSQFLGDEAYRKRFWAGSHRAWSTFTTIVPNEGHRALARLESAGVVNGVITQNVDNLHTRAGSLRVVDVHGSMNRIRCLSCGQIFSRAKIETQLRERNPRFGEDTAVSLAPDGDADVTNVDFFQVPTCSVCDGMLKPDVVYFGEVVPVEKFSAAQAIVSEASGLLVLGSSLAVNTGIRILEQARRENKPIIIVNRGTTKGDSRAALRVESGITEFLEGLERSIATARVTEPQ